MLFCNGTIVVACNHVVYLLLRPLAKVDFRPPRPNSGGNLNSRVPQFWGFRGHPRIYARGLLYGAADRTLSNLYFHTACQISDACSKLTM